MMSIRRISASALLLASSGLTVAVPSSNANEASLGLGDISSLSSKRADASLTGYLGAFFLGDDPDVYFYLSQGNDAIAFSALNGGKPILVPTVGTGGVRDPAIVTGGGSEAGKKWYIVGTDLDISKTTWDASERTGSRGIFVWESTNLVDWTGERLVVVEDATAGMVWAPEAIWDASKGAIPQVPINYDIQGKAQLMLNMTGQYFTYWASKFYDASDTNHNGTATNIKIRYAYTSDFKTFTAPLTYIDYSPTDIIDLTILPYPGSSSSFLRFIKDETLKNVFVEYSTAGLFGTWTRPGGSSAYIRSQTEGPAAYWDNSVSGEAHLLVDDYGGSGYYPLVSKNPTSNSDWTNSSTANFPTGLRHGSVLPINATMMSALGAATWA